MSKSILSKFQVVSRGVLLFVTSLILLLAAYLSTISHFIEPAPFYAQPEYKATYLNDSSVSSVIRGGDQQGRSDSDSGVAVEKTSGQSKTDAADTTSSKEGKVERVLKSEIRTGNRSDTNEEGNYAHAQSITDEAKTAERTEGERQRNQSEDGDGYTRTSDLDNEETEERISTMENAQESPDAESDKLSASASSEPNYTISFQRAEESNFSSIFTYDGQGNRQLMEGKWMQMPGVTKELVVSAPELFDKIPLHFLDNFKNPCWLRGETELNCLPYFYVIGMFKCGTTDLYDKIVAHPDVVDVPKEPHWWGPRRHGFTKTPIHKEEVLRARTITGRPDDRSLEWYLNLYKFTGVQELINSTTTDKQGRKYHKKVFGDASISTAYSLGLEWTERYPNASEPPYTNADLIRALQPNAKIILMIRDPTDRANSWYWYTNRQKETPEKWHTLAMGYMNCFKECLRSHNLRYCAYASGCPYALIPDLQVGIYHVYLRDWMNAFSRDGVHVIRLEDWEANPVNIYRELLSFLDLRQLTKGEEREALGRTRKNVLTRKHPDALPKTTRALQDFYRPYNKELAKLLGGDKYLYT